MGTSLESARRAKRLFCARLDGHPDVAGVGLARTDDGYVLRVNLRKAVRSVPANVDGVEVTTVVTGAPRPLGAPATKAPVKKSAAAGRSRAALA